MLRVRSIAIILILVVCIVVPTYAHAQTNVQAQLAVLLQQLLSIQQQLTKLLQEAGLSNVSLPPTPSFSSTLSPLLPQTGVSSLLLPTFGTISSIVSTDVSTILLPTTSTTNSPTSSSGPLCRYYDEKLSEGSTRQDNPCPGSTCPSIPTATLTCKSAEWYYSTGVSVCTPPPLLFDTAAQRAYRESLGCVSNAMAAQCSNSAYPCPTYSNSIFRCVARLQSGSCPSTQ